MKRYIIITLLLLSTILQAQEYTYISDRTFLASSDLLDYTFIPAFIVYPDENNSEDSEETPIGVNEFSFGITQNYLYIEGNEIEGVYSINSINPTDYGYIIATMNARNPTIQGHLKIILNDYNNANALIFKMSTNTDELIFKIAEIPEDIEKEEADFFTNMDNPATTTDVIWNRTYYPFFRIGEKQQRLRIEDSVEISIATDTIIIKKKKKEKVEIERFITISYKGFDDNGNRTNYEQRYEVKGLKERQSRDEKATIDKYLIEAEVKGLPEKFIFFYLNEKRAISKIELGPNQFLIRGY
ncbi:MAG: hypothetical protein AB8G11_19365 [Saprospiraceae bacterium]